MTDDRHRALTRLRDLRRQRAELNRAAVDALQRDDRAGLDDIIEEEHVNLQEQRIVIGSTDGIGARQSRLTSTDRAVAGCGFGPPNCSTWWP